MDGQVLIPSLYYASFSRRDNVWKASSASSRTIWISREKERRLIFTVTNVITVLNLCCYVNNRHMIDVLTVFNYLCTLLIIRNHGGLGSGNSGEGCGVKEQGIQAKQTHWNCMFPDFSFVILKTRIELFRYEFSCQTVLDHEQFQIFTHCNQPGWQLETCSVEL